MIRLPSNTKVFLALGATDMRKAMNGFSIIASEHWKNTNKIKKRSIKGAFFTEYDFIKSCPRGRYCYQQIIVVAYSNAITISKRISRKQGR
jgi:hypothetical protein